MITVSRLVRVSLPVASLVQAQAAAPLRAQRCVSAPATGALYDCCCRSHLNLY